MDAPTPSTSTQRVTLRWHGRPTRFQCRKNSTNDPRYQKRALKQSINNSNTVTNKNSRTWASRPWVPVLRPIVQAISKQWTIARVETSFEIINTKYQSKSRYNNNLSSHTSKASKHLKQKEPLIPEHQSRNRWHKLSNDSNYLFSKPTIQAHSQRNCYTWSVIGRPGYRRPNFINTSCMSYFSSDPEYQSVDR